MLSPDVLEELLAALGEHLAAGGGPPAHLVVCGGAAMNGLGLNRRTTRDVDVVALWDEREGGFLCARPLPQHVIEARDQVTENFPGTPKNWLNDGPATIVRDFHLPRQAEERLVTRHFGSHLTVYYLGREDLICLKLDAYGMRREARDIADLRAMQPTAAELLRAVEWVRSFASGAEPDLIFALETLGAHDVARRISQTL